MVIISVMPRKVAAGERKCIRLQAGGKEGIERFVSGLTIRGDCRIIVDHENPLPSGARVWIECDEVEVEK